MTAGSPFGSARNAYFNSASATSTATLIGATTCSGGRSIRPVSSSISASATTSLLVRLPSSNRGSTASPKWMREKPGVSWCISR